MNTTDLAQFRTWFDEHVATYHEPEARHQENILLKEAHTRRVCEAMERITGALGLPPEDRMLAYTAALFHDLGRFPQYRRYRTFRDPDSANHAKLALWELNRYRVLHRLSRDERFLVSRAIIFHNRISLPSSLDDRTRTFSQMLRDADKVDIWKVMTDHFLRTDGHVNPTMELGLDRTPGVRDEVYRSVLAERIPNYVDLKTVDEFKVLLMSWVFDLNFRPTFEMVAERRYIEILVDLLPETPLLRETAEFIGGHVARQLVV